MHLAVHWETRNGQRTPQIRVAEILSPLSTKILHRLVRKSVTTAGGHGRTNLRWRKALDMPLFYNQPFENWDKRRVGHRTLRSSVYCLLGMVHGYCGCREKSACSITGITSTYTISIQQNESQVLAISTLSGWEEIFGSARVNGTFCRPIS